MLTITPKTICSNWTVVMNMAIILGTRIFIAFSVDVMRTKKQLNYNSCRDDAITIMSICLTRNA